MTRDDIIKMAREAGFNPVSYTDANLELFERFAALVAAEKEKQIIDILERLQERNESHTYYKYAINVIKGEI
jgi:Cdc6-like AAA superfamily ATPase